MEEKCPKCGHDKKKFVFYILLFRSYPMESLYISIGVAASIIGVSTKTMRRWDEKGRLNSAFRTAGNHRRYYRNKILKFVKKRTRRPFLAPDIVRCALYGRVSASRQKKSGELERQIALLRRHARTKRYAVQKAYSDVGSRLNDTRKGLAKMLRDAANGKFDMVIVSYNDRLARFGLGVIKEYLRSWGVRLEVLHTTVVDEIPHAELVTDLTAILYSFIGKLYRLRRQPNRN